ncbi:MAG: ATP-binding cassette domain-containing protein [Actinomycetota bacterium]
MTTHLRARDLVAGVGGHRTAPLDAAVEGNRIVGFVGPSGVGKTTVFRTLSGLVPPVAGVVEWGPEPPVVCFQHDGLLRWRSALENVTFGLGRRPGPEETGRARDLLATLGLQGLDDRRPAELSGGQRRRVAIARSILATRSVLLVDEPFAHLDDDAGALVVAALRRVVEAGTPVAVALHSDTDAARIVDDVIHVTVAATGPR